VRILEEMAGTAAEVGVGNAGAMLAPISGD